MAALDGDWPRYDGLIPETLNGDYRSRWGTHLRYAAWRGDRRILLEIEDALGRADVPHSLRFVLDKYVQVYVHGRGIEFLLEWHAFVEDGAWRHMGGLRNRQWLLQLAVEAAAFSGQREEALRFLKKADEAGVFDLLWLDRCPLLTSLRTEPEVAALRKNFEARANAIADAVLS